MISDKALKGDAEMKTMKLAVAVAVMACASGCGVLDAIDGTLRKIGALPSVPSCEGVDMLAVVSIETDGQTGVGVVVADQTVFTPYHVVKRAGVVMVRFFGHYRSGYHKEVEARVIYSNPGLDQCLLHVNTETPHVIPMGTAGSGEAVMVGLSGGRTNRFGQKMAYPTANPCTIDGVSYESAARTRMGDSGSPIIQAGKVVGLVRGPSMMVSVKRAEKMYAMIGR